MKVNEQVKNRKNISISLRLILLWLFSSHFSLVNAQTPAYYTINNESGLPSNEVYRITQDKNGSIWIGSNAGLHKYNGIDFINHPNASRNSRAISFLQEDAHGRMWSKNFYGQIFRVENGDQKLFLNLQTSDPNYPQFTFDADRHLFIYSEDEIRKYDDKGTLVAKVKALDLLKGENIICVKHIGNSVLGLTDNMRLFQLDPTSMKITHVSKSDPSEQKISASSYFMQHGNNILLFAELSTPKRSYKLYSVNDELELSTKFSFDEVEQDERIHGVYYDGSTIWAFGSNGVLALNASKQRLFAGKRISHVLKDSEGMYWFTSLDEGIFVIPDMKISILNDNNALNEQHFTIAKELNANQVIFGSYSGQLYLSTKGTSEFKQVYASSEESFLAVKKMERYKHYLIVSRGRLCVIDERNGKQYFPKFSNVRDFCFKGDELYLVFHQFIIKLSFDELFKDDPQYKILSEEGGKEIEYDPVENKLVVSLSKGTFWIDENDKWTEIKLNNRPVFSSSLSYHSGILWIGTLSNGVLGYKKKQKIYHLSKDHQLGENAILLLKASKEFLWVVTDKYIYRIQYSSGRTERMGRNLCINPADVLNIEIGMDKVFLATNTSIYTFPSTLRMTNLKPAIVRVGEISVNGKRIHPKGKIQLDSENSNVRFYFSTSLLKNRGDYTVYYQLKGISDRWEAVPSDVEYILIPKLPSGDFEFRMKVSDPFGIDSEVVVIPITVSRPYWKSIWFVLILAVLFVLMCIYIASLRIRYIRKRSEEKNVLIQSQLTALRTQMNPHFMFNTLNSLQDLILKHDFKNTNYYLSKYAALLRMILTNSEKSEITIEEEISMLDVYLKLEKLRFGEDFRYEIDCSEELNQSNYLLPPMLLQPYIENAIKHGLLHKSGSKILSIVFTENEKSVICTIEDNGIGRKKSAEINDRQGKTYASFSSDANDKRMRLMRDFHNQHYSVQIIDLDSISEKTGTRVLISFAKRT